MIERSNLQKKETDPGENTWTTMEKYWAVMLIHY